MNGRCAPFAVAETRHQRQRRRRQQPTRAGAAASHDKRGPQYAPVQPLAVRIERGEAILGDRLAALIDRLALRRDAERRDVNEPLDTGLDAGAKSPGGALRMHGGHGVGAVVAHQAGAVHHDFEGRDFLAQPRLVVAREIDRRARGGDDAMPAFTQTSGDMPSDKSGSANN